MELLGRAPHFLKHLLEARRCQGQQAQALEGIRFKVDSFLKTMT